MVLIDECQHCKKLIDSETARSHNCGAAAPQNTVAEKPRFVKCPQCGKSVNANFLPSHQSHYCDGRQVNRREAAVPLVTSTISAKNRATSSSSSINFVKIVLAIFISFAVFIVWTDILFIKNSNKKANEGAKKDSPMTTQQKEAHYKKDPGEALYAHLGNTDKD